MDNSWVKLHRKVGNNKVMFDSKACQVFLWLLIHVDKKTGTFTAGRFQIAHQLRLNSSTVYKILKRLEKKYEIVTLRSNNKFTEISLINWAKYQAVDHLVTQSGNNKVTTKEQQSNNKVTLNKTIKKIRREEERETSISYLLNIPSNDLAEFSVAFTCTDRQIINKGQGLYDYCQSKGKAYRDYKAFLRNSLRTDFGDRMPTFVPNLATDLELTPEEQEAAHRKLQEIRDTLKRKTTIN